jgi:DNA polymerase-4
MHLSPLWLFLDLNSYFASVEQQMRPELRGRPVAVVPLETDATCAIAASYEAKAFGIKTGTPIYEAKRRCKELICIKANHQHYVEYHHRILEEIERHIPVTQICSIDEVACELDRSESSPQEAIRLAKRIKQGIHERVGEAIHCSIGIAPNRFLAKVATEMEKPDGLVVIEAQEIPQKLFSLQFDDIPGIGKAMQKRLHRVGVYNMEQLYQLAPKQMRAIWHSVAGERMYYRLRGVELEDRETQRRTVGHSHVLAPENRPEPEARRIAMRLLLKAASRLRRLEYHSTTLTLSLRIENGPRIGIDKRFRAACDNAMLSRIGQKAWEELIPQMGKHTPRIKKVAVTLHGLVANDAVQPDLFDHAEKKIKSEKQTQLSAAMDALNQRFGRNTITTAATLGEANTVTGTKIAFSRIPNKEEFKE